MAWEAGFAAQVPSLPEGGGALGGLGETFTPDLSTGTGHFAIPLDCPNGPNDIGPKLALRYSSSGGNGPFGLGWSLPLPRILRSIAHGYPSYSDDDRLVFEGAGELLRDGETLRPQVDDGTYRGSREGDGFRMVDREGRYLVFGASPDSRLSDPHNPARTFAWHLDQVEDPLGYAARYSWMRDRGQLYVSAVRYGCYEIRFDYEQRTDTLRHGRTGFLVETRLRCSGIELHLTSTAGSLLRRWTLAYTQDPVNGCSLLSRVSMTGFDAAGAPLEAPPLTMTYSEAGKTDLSRFTAQDDGREPGPLRRTDRRVELIDWNGDGLPDLLEISGAGNARLWPNDGNGVWGRPRSLGTLPLFSSPSAPIGLVDMNGDGAADLVRMDSLLAGYVPRDPQGGFQRAVAWRRAPSTPPAAAGAHLVDLDGDGVADLLAPLGNSMALYYREDQQGWEKRPQIIPRGSGPQVRLDDPRVFTADMTGDNSSDLVRVSGGGVLYWPYLGRGRWGSAVIMDPSPRLPFDFDPGRLYVADIDGDGCADLVYVDADGVHVWINQGGNGFGPERIIRHVPVGGIGSARIADMRGSGTSGLMWSTGSLPGHHAVYLYLDFCGSRKPHLLEEIDNGLGLRTSIRYTTSARQAASDRESGHPWTTFLPVVIPVVSEVTLTEATTGRESRTRYEYHDGRFDGRLREFCGFGRVATYEEGDETTPTLRTVRWFHTGIDLQTSEEPRTLRKRYELRAIRGRQYREERYGIDGSPLQSMPYGRSEQQWTVLVEETAAGAVFHPRLLDTVETTFEREAEATSSVTRSNQAWDERGNITLSEEICSLAQDPAKTRVLRTATEFAVDGDGRFLSKPFRIRQFDHVGAPVSDSILYYDDAPEGTTGPRGLLTRRCALALTDALVAEVYPQDPPDLESLGYFRRDDEDGWWINEVRYERTRDENGLRGKVIAPLGGTVTFTFDEHDTYPVEISDPRANTTTAEHDYRTCRVTRIENSSGECFTNHFDSLSRQVSMIEPEDTAAHPTVLYTYETGQSPSFRSTSRRAKSGSGDTIDSRDYFDGEGALIEHRIIDGLDETASSSFRYNSRKLLIEKCEAFQASPGLYAAPPSDVIRQAFRYDALGRVIWTQNPDGGVHTARYGPSLVEEWDPEDNDPESPHAGTPVIKHLDASGRTTLIERIDAGSRIRTTFEYNLRGQVTRQQDALGNQIRMWYDLRGNLLRVDKPECGSATVYDAADNPVEARGRDGRRVVRKYDRSGRLLEVRHGDSGPDPVARYTYHDANTPAPPQASNPRGCGRCVKIDDEAGSTRFDYAPGGRVKLKRWVSREDGKTYDLNLKYRPDGQIQEVVYPDSGSGRRTVRYEYNRRGLLARIPSYVKQIDYDLQNRRTRVVFQNSLEQTYAYDPGSGRLRESNLADQGRSLRQAGYVMDRVGNILDIASTDPELATHYSYDDDYRLIAAKSAAGEEWNYAYDAVGNLTFKSDVGAFQYGQDGAPSTCLTNAGTSTFAYSPMGEALLAPWGKQRFDANGRLVEVETSDGVPLEFVYNAGGERVIERRDGATWRVTPDAHFTIENGVLIASILDGRSCLARAPADGKVIFLHSDHLGSPCVLSGPEGEVIESRRYDPYGGLIEPSLPTGADVAVGYTGGIPEGATGLLFLGSRYYHPMIGRFISPDDLVAGAEDPYAWNGYMYCRGNPLRYVDPTGHGFWHWVIPSVVVVALVAVAVFAPPVAGLIVTGMISGGVIGGIAGARHGGGLEGGAKGALVGAAVGGTTALAGHYAGPAFANLLGLGGNGFWAPVVSGAVNGTAVGAGCGFSVGYAGGRGSLDDIWGKVWRGALLGMATGAALGALSTRVAPEDSPLDAALKPAEEVRKSGEAAWNDPLSAKSLDFLERAGNVLPDTVGAFIQNSLEHVAPHLGAQAAQIVIVNTVTGMHGMGVGSSWIETGVKYYFTVGVLGPLLGDLTGWANSQLTSDEPQSA